MSDHYVTRSVEQSLQRDVPQTPREHGLFLPPSYLPPSHEATVFSAEPPRRKQGILLPRSYCSTSREITTLPTLHTHSLPQQPQRKHSKTTSSIILPEPEPPQPLNAKLLTQLAAIVVLFLIALGLDVDLFLDNPVRILSIAIVLLILCSTLLLFRLKRHYKVVVLTGQDLLTTTISLRAVKPAHNKNVSEGTQSRLTRFRVLQNSTSVYLQAIKTNITERGDR